MDGWGWSRPDDEMMIVNCPMVCLKSGCPANAPLWCDAVASTIKCGVCVQGTVWIAARPLKPCASDPRVMVCWMGVRCPKRVSVSQSMGGSFVCVAFLCEEWCVWSSPRPCGWIVHAPHQCHRALLFSADMMLLLMILDSWHPVASVASDARCVMGCHFWNPPPIRASYAVMTLCAHAHAHMNPSTST